MNNLGQILRNKREERGITLKDVETVLSIRVKYLEALELGNYTIIPGEVYVKGFLRNYANYLGLNAEEMVQLYKKEQQPSANTEIEMTEEQAADPERKPVKRTGFTFTFSLGVAFLLLIIAGTTYFVYMMQNESPQNTNIPPINTAPVPQAPAPQAPAPQVPSTAITPPPQNIAKPIPQNIKLSMKATEDCWVQVVADGTETFKGFLKRGDSKTWQANKQMEITLGNAGGVDITYNDQPQAPLGESGDVVHKVYTLQ